MDLTSPKTIKELLSKYETRPSKGLGQNFLIDKNVLEKIITSADIKPDDTILEVGPGIGTLTQALANKAGKVIAVEKSETMCKILAETMKDYKNIEVINADILKFLSSKPQGPNPNKTPKNKNQTNNWDLENFDLFGHWSLGIGNYKVVANIPYYITAPLIRALLENKNPPESIVLMLQKEVAQRICSTPPNMSLLAVSVQFYANAKIVSYVPKNCFWPAPKVDSAIIRITPKSEIRSTKSKTNSNFEIQNSKFFTIVKAGFSQPRKQIVGNLSKILKIDKEKAAGWLTKNKINPSQRAETLSINDWIKLVSSL